MSYISINFDDLQGLQAAYTELAGCLTAMSKLESWGDSTVRVDLDLILVSLGFAGSERSAEITNAKHQAGQAVASLIRQSDSMLNTVSEACIFLNTYIEAAFAAEYESPGQANLYLQTLTMQEKAIVSGSPYMPVAWSPHDNHQIQSWSESKSRKLSIEGLGGASITYTYETIMVGDPANPQYEVVVTYSGEVDKNLFTLPGSVTVEGGLHGEVQSTYLLSSACQVKLFLSQLQSGGSNPQFGTSNTQWPTPLRSALVPQGTKSYAYGTSKILGEPGTTSQPAPMPSKIDQSSTVDVTGSASASANLHSGDVSVKGDVTAQVSLGGTSDTSTKGGAPVTTSSGFVKVDVQAHGSVDIGGTQHPVVDASGYLNASLQVTTSGQVSGSFTSQGNLEILGSNFQIPGGHGFNAMQIQFNGQLGASNSGLSQNVISDLQSGDINKQMVGLEYALANGVNLEYRVAYGTYDTSTSDFLSLYSQTTTDTQWNYGSWEPFPPSG